MAARDLINTIEAAGLTLEARSGRLVVTPRERITPSLREVIRRNRDAILADMGIASDWFVHVTNHEPFRVSYCPSVDQQQVLDDYPSAAAVEPVAPPTSKSATPAEADELRGLIEAVYCDETDDDRADALAEALSDPAGALRCYRAIQKGKIRQEVGR
jgi:hypothetical protein